MSKSRLLMPLLAVALAPGLAAAQPRIAIVVVSHEGLTEAQADDIAALSAKLVGKQTQALTMQGEAVRTVLPAGGVAAGCEDDAACGRDLGKRLDTDETLLLTIQKTAKHSMVKYQRVPRDPAREPSRVSVRLGGHDKKHHLKALAGGIATLFPSGSVVAYEEPSPPPPPVVTPRESAKAEAEVIADEAAADEATTVDEEGQPIKSRKARKVKAAAAVDLTAPPVDEAHKPVHKKGWFIGLMTGVAVVAAAGIAVGVYFAIPPQPTGAPITLP